MLNLLRNRSGSITFNPARYPAWYDVAIGNLLRLGLIVDCHAYPAIGSGRRGQWLVRVRHARLEGDGCGRARRPINDRSILWTERRRGGRRLSIDDLPGRRSARALELLRVIRLCPGPVELHPTTFPCWFDRALLDLMRCRLIVAEDVWLDGRQEWVVRAESTVPYRNA